MQRVFLVHKGLALTAKSIKVITEATAGLGKRYKRFTIVDSLADASICVVGDDIWPKRHLLTVDETENLPIYPVSALITALRTKKSIKLPEEPEKNAADIPAAAAAEVSAADVAANMPATDEAVSPIRNTRGTTSGSGPYSKPATPSVSPYSEAVVEEIRQLLSDFCEMYELLNDPFRRKGYRAALDWLTMNADGDILAEPRIAVSVKEKIRELLRTGECQKLKSLRESDPFFAIRKELLKIHGVGQAHATKFIHKYKIRSIEELRREVTRGVIELDKGQAVGLQYFEDLQIRIPRDEVEEMGELVRKTAAEELGVPMELVICGSYRRGAETCGDADVILIPEVEEEEPLDIKPLVAKLEEIKFVEAVLQLSPSPDTVQTFLGVTRLPNKPNAVARRIDVKIYPKSCKAFALIQWSGGEQFLRSMKIRASSMGYRLNDRGLFPVERSTKEVLGPGVPLHTEQAVFEFLKIPYKPEYPWDQTLLGIGTQAWLKPEVQQESAASL